MNIISYAYFSSLGQTSRSVVAGSFIELLFLFPLYKGIKLPSPRSGSSLRFWLCDCIFSLSTAPESDLPVSHCSWRVSTLAGNCCFREGALGPHYVPARAAPTRCGTCVPELTASLRPVSPQPCQQKFAVFCLLNTPQTRAPGEHSRPSCTRRRGRKRADTGLESGCSTLVARNSPEWASCRFCKNDFSQTLSLK